MIVSVLMTAYNREQFIADAIESVQSSKYEQFELIIVDDCSIDNTLRIAKKFEAKDKRIKVFLNEENLGDYPNRNKAAFYASGKYIKYLDSDDIMNPYCLGIMVEAMEMFPDAGFGLSAIGDPLHPYPFLITQRKAYLENFNAYGHFGRAPGSSIINKQAFDSVNGFSGKRMIGDNELWYKLARYYPMVKLPRDLVWDRVHSDQESRTRYATKEYGNLRKKVMLEALLHDECPLNQEEIKDILAKERKKSIKQKIKKWL
jgi:glycosyltransferase involved in cell wall biosynthesis